MNPDELIRLFNRLAFICRFNGAVKRFYSVAEHTVLGLETMEADAQSEDAMRAFFVHDLPEAMLGIGDVTRNVKRDPFVAAIVSPMEREAFARIQTVLPFPTDTHTNTTVKHYDRMMAVAEVEVVADGIAQDHPGDYCPHIHGRIARRLRRRDDPFAVPPRSMRDWCRDLWPGVV